MCDIRSMFTTQVIGKFYSQFQGEFNKVMDNYKQAPPHMSNQFLNNNTRSLTQSKPSKLEKMS